MVVDVGVGEGVGVGTDQAENGWEGRRGQRMFSAGPLVHSTTCRRHRLKREDGTILKPEMLTGMCRGLSPLRTHSP